MSQSFRNAFLQARDRTRRSVRGIALAAGVSEDQLKSLAQGKSQTTNVDDAVKVARAFGVTLDEFLEGKLGPSVEETIAVAGRVGAGARIPLADPYAKGDGLYHIRRPAQLPPGSWVAVEVQGDSMEPAYEEGDVLIYRREVLGVPSEAIGQRCVAKDAEGNVWVKRVRRREGQPDGLVDLISFHADSPPMYDVRLEWAAPIAMHLQKAFVARLSAHESLAAMRTPEA
ncbi:MAG: S24 family peptidase [Roseicyclus sp.]